MLFRNYVLKVLTVNFIKFVFYKDYKLYFLVSPKNVFSLLFFLKKHSVCQYKTLIDLIVSDYPEKKYRFCLIYSLLSVSYNSRLNLSIKHKEFSSLTSVSKLYRSADWAEREVWDMFGIVFFYHNDLRRILTDYGFSGFPLRKDFPLTGFVEILYSQKQKRLIYQRVVLSQEYRNFWFDHYLTYWGFQKFFFYSRLLVVDIAHLYGVQCDRHVYAKLKNAKLVYNPFSCIINVITFKYLIWKTQKKKIPSVI